MAWAEIIGPGAPLRHAALCLGFVLFAPETYYPPHAHPAVELYHVISGAALWTAGNEVTRQPRARSCCNRPACRMRHARRMSRC